MTKYKAKKSLGQNFLKSIPIVKGIVLAGEVEKNDIILEIGPGKGVLTEKLLEKAGKVIAIEKDNVLFTLLCEKFKEEIQNGKLTLENKDILEIMPEDYGLKATNYKIIANIPYNITGAILKKFLTTEKNPKTMVLMVQREVAERILARDGKESLLSVSVKAYGEPKMVLKVPAKYFSPAPKVDSAVILIKNISKKRFLEEKVGENKFWTLVRGGFAHKRKILAKNLKNIDQKTDWENILEEITGKKTSRAEELSTLQWFLLAK